MDAHRGAPPAGQQVVHVRGDSKTELEALFNAVMNPSKATRQPPSVPMRMRKFPDSFFKPPEPRGHSRQASSDGGLCGSLAPHHVRAHSSPASLPVNSLSAQADADAAATPIIPDDVPLPDGWEMAKTSTGQRYFINHVHRTTTWQDPRLSQLQSAAAQHQIACTPSHAHSFSNPAPTTQPKNIVPETGPLPEGWEQAVTTDGEMYYIDHINQATTWDDPRLAPKVNPAILSLAMQQRLEKLRLKQGIPPQFAPQLNETKHTRIQVQEAGGSNQMPGGMDHDRSAQMLVPSVDIRIRALNQEPNLNGAHSRNESTDSGLSVSSLSRTSDHMLSSVDHMDTGDSSEPPSMGLQESMPVLPINEDLMPGIPDSLTSDMLMEMDTVLSGPHMDRDSLLTWL
ncbi:transcriptional coactivator YAP1-like isoform X1 [Xiphophorus maculatus]|uniref:transcriptional coactivator YAP1-like isoform X1 n=1 Tax=Xiphophorus maculatus TaxID=8083 RepID=UPI000C6DACEA|nr:transcriptional coactivator YAP1-like isoform X1 [Xiphophorus maculatus]XP_027887757.1 transcriptional coactivator YAP1-like isoform X1 [Xiphophorus couchianus]XP_027887758.1 transcriptional coactivator YAP1-like isoform X1 [Xiphophorus couchianus]XP_032432154.1 transcriptional coactivator YAP1-like isoform X1 [Xiphophorus hellerii]XP_032432155.1 transcriptional coactivator YAP1-like isoform X1 [Xiphophorus hellerii]